MPNCFSLTRKSDLAAGPVVLQTIDAEMCAAFGAPCHEKYWFRGWYNTVGLMLALGKSFPDIYVYVGEQDADFPDSPLAPIVEWLDEHFTPDAWAERSTR